MCQKVVSMVLAVALNIIFCAVGVVSASPSYTVTDLGEVGSWNKAWGVNDSGQVVGQNNLHAFLYSDSTMTDLGALSSTGESEAFGINNRGQVVGYTETIVIDGRTADRAFLYSGSTMTDLGSLAPYAGRSYAYGINSSGQIVGCTQIDNQNGFNHAFLYSGSTMKDLGTLGGIYSSARGINDSGQVVGESTLDPYNNDIHAFLYSGSTMKDLGTLGGKESFARGINDSGQVVGWSYTASGIRAFLYDGTTMHDLGTLGGNNSSAQGINDRGQVVGMSTIAGGNVLGHAFIYNGSTMTDLNTQIDPSSGWILTNGFDINDAGQIVGRGVYCGEATRAFLLTPVPQTYAILVGSHAPTYYNSDGLPYYHPDGLRGDRDIDNVAAKLTWVDPDRVNIIDYDWTDPDTVSSEIQNAISSIKSRIKPGDSLIFYYAGHGSGGSGVGVDDSINPVQGSDYQDNTLASLLADSAFDDVKKWVFLDSCHSEGFWKNDYPGDRDLESLHNIAFLAAAAEDKYAYSDPSNGYTGYFTNAILSGLTSTATFANLYNLAQNAKPKDSPVGYLRDDGYGTIDWDIVGFTSADFDPNTQLNGMTVPEPSAITLLGVCAFGLLTYAWRRRRRAAQHALHLD